MRTRLYESEGGGNPVWRDRIEGSDAFGGCLGCVEVRRDGSELTTLWVENGYGGPKEKVYLSDEGVKDLIATLDAAIRPPKYCCTDGAGE